MSRQIITNKRLIIICGPTAVGKTDLAIKVARHFNTSIISADSRQFYKEMNAATAKPTPLELAAAKHYFIDSLSIHDEYSAGHFERDAIDLLDQLFVSKDEVVVVGGSGLYIKAITDGLDEFPDVEMRHLAELNAIFKKQGIGALQQELKQKDELYYQQVDLQNAQRLIRALSVIRQSGSAFSSFRSESSVKRPFQPVFVRLSMDRQQLYDRINSRVDSFIDLGLLAESKELYPFKDLKPLKTVGYAEMFDFLDGKYTLTEALDKIRQHTRNYAKRQETWLRKQIGDPVWHPQDTNLILKYLTRNLPG